MPLLRRKGATLNKLEHAIQTLRECADSYDSLPEGLKRSAIFGGLFVNPMFLRREADYLQDQMDMVIASIKEIPEAQALLSSPSMGFSALPITTKTIDKIQEIDGYGFIPSDLINDQGRPKAYFIWTDVPVDGYPAVIPAAAFKMKWAFALGHDEEEIDDEEIIRCWPTD